MATENSHPDRDVGCLFSTSIDPKTSKNNASGSDNSQHNPNSPGIPECLSYGNFDIPSPIHPQPVDSLLYILCLRFCFFLFRSRYHGELASVVAFAYQDKQRALPLPALGIEGTGCDEIQKRVGVKLGVKLA